MAGLRAFGAALSVAIVLAGAAYGASAATRGIEIRAREGGRTVAMYAESHALLIGVSDYVSGWPPLRGVREDIPAVKAALEKQGFQVEVVMDPDRRQMDDAFRAFINRYGQKTDNRLLFYFAGHGHSMELGYGGQMGYLVGRDAPNPNLDKVGFKERALSMQVIETYARNIESKHALFMFDACFAGSVFDATRAIPEVIAEKTGRPVREFITSGTADQQVPDRSIFRRQFVAALEGEGDLDHDGYVTGAELGQFLEAKVTNYSRRAQTPQYGKLRDPLLDKGDFVFALPGSETAAPAPAAPAGAAEVVFWQSIQGSANAADFEAYLQQFPSGTFAGLARNRLAALVPAPAAPLPAQPAVGIFPKAYAPGDTFKDCDVCPEMVVVPAGTFDMGDSHGEGDERPMHPVTIAKPFAVGRYEVKVAEFAAFARDTGYRAGNSCWLLTGAAWKERDGATWRDPGFSQTDNDPVVCVGWDDAKAYVRWLGRKAGHEYRLPSEAEWEYAARAHSTERYGFGDSSSEICAYGNIADNDLKQISWRNDKCSDGYGKRTAPVGSFRPNAFGLHDTLGNVREWVEDCWNRSYNGAPTDGSAWTKGECDRRVTRGGSWLDDLSEFRTSNRKQVDADQRSDAMGFRVAKTLDPRGKQGASAGSQVAAAHQTPPPKPIEGCPGDLNTRTMSTYSISFRRFTTREIREMQNVMAKEFPCFVKLQAAEGNNQGHITYVTWASLEKVDEWLGILASDMGIDAFTKVAVEGGKKTGLVVERR